MAKERSKQTVLLTIAIVLKMNHGLELYYQYSD